MSDERLRTGRPLTDEEIARIRSLFGNDEPDLTVPVTNEASLLGLFPEAEAALNHKLTGIVKKGFIVRTSLEEKSRLRVVESRIGLTLNQKAGVFAVGHTTTEALLTLSRLEHDPNNPAGINFEGSENTSFHMGDPKGTGTLDCLILDGWSLEVSFNENARDKGYDPIVAALTKEDGTSSLALGASFTEAVEGAIQRLQTNGVIPLNPK